MSSVPHTYQKEGIAILRLGYLRTDEQTAVLNG